MERRSFPIKFTCSPIIAIYFIFLESTVALAINSWMVDITTGDPPVTFPRETIPTPPYES
jgi:hypothetical protein